MPNSYEYCALNYKCGSPPAELEARPCKPAIQSGPKAHFFTEVSKSPRAWHRVMGLPPRLTNSQNGAPAVCPDSDLCVLQVANWEEMPTSTVLSLFSGMGYREFLGGIQNIGLEYNPCWLREARHIVKSEASWGSVWAWDAFTDARGPLCGFSRLVEEIRTTADLRKPCKLWVVDWSIKLRPGIDKAAFAAYKQKFEGNGKAYVAIETEEDLKAFILKTQGLSDPANNAFNFIRSLKALIEEEADWMDEDSEEEGQNTWPFEMGVVGCID